jgi:hypothetical protein
MTHKEPYNLPPPLPSHGWAGHSRWGSTSGWPIPPGLITWIPVDDAFLWTLPFQPTLHPRPQLWSWDWCCHRKLKIASIYFS